MLAQGKNLETVTSVKTIYNFSNICGDLNKTCRAYYILEILDKLTPDGYKDTRVFNICVKTFQILDNNAIKDTIQEDLVIQAGEFKLLKTLGFAPRLNHCLQCQDSVSEKDEYYFSNLFNGVICSDCRSFDKTSSSLTVNQLKLLRIMDREDFDLIVRLNINNKELVYLGEILNNYIRFIIEKDIKSLNFIRKVDSLK
jgi:DNA repair protein RecO (recombination protein O)